MRIALVMTVMERISKSDGQPAIDVFYIVPDRAVVQKGLAESSASVVGR